MLEVAKILKDIVLVAGFGLVCAASVRTAWFKRLLRDRLVWLIAGYALLTLLLALVKPTDQDAEILGIVYNLRFLLFFLYACLLAGHYKPEWLARKALRVVLAAALPVLLFGFVQYMWLPDDALTHVGYSRANGVLPAFFIDDKPDLERVMSTVRDPNSYGSYLLIVIAIALAYVLRLRQKDLRSALFGFLALAALNLYFTFSRSAWIGAVVVLAVSYIINYINRKRPAVSRKLVITAAVLLVFVAGGLFAARDTYFVRNVILHADESTVLEDPNQLRVRFWRESLESAAENPLGYGPGTAGIVSIRNDKQGVVLNENYYLQILYEVGIVGLVLFIAILAVVAVRLYRRRSTFALALLAAFIGLAATNFFVHIWSVEAVAYTWWGLAGLVVIRRAHEKIPKTAAGA